MPDTEDISAQDHLVSSGQHDAEVPNHIESILEDLDQLPTETKRRVLVQETFGMMGIGRLSQENEIAKKINEDHITNLLDGSKEQMRKEYQERHERKIFTVILVFLALAFFVTVIILLKDNPDILEKIIYSVAGLVAGAFGGYGYGRHKSSED